MKVAKKQLEKGITWKFNRIALFNFNAVLTRAELLLSISIEWCTYRSSECWLKSSTLDYKLNQ